MSKAIMSKAIKPSQFKPGKRYCFEQPNPSRAFSESKKVYFNTGVGLLQGSTLPVNFGEAVVFIRIHHEEYVEYVDPYYLFLLSNGSIGWISGSQLTFQLGNKALKIFRVDK